MLPAQLLRYGAIVLVAFALARPQSSFVTGNKNASGIDIMMVLDFSQSMNIEDLADRPRIDIAKETMERFIKSRPDDRIGFVMFSGAPLTLSPPTLDHERVLSEMRNAEIGRLPDGTAIGDALAVAVGRLRESKAKSRVIVLLTDGDNNVGQIDPATAGELAAGYGLRVYTIAIGREGRVKLAFKRPGPFGTVTQYQWFDNALNPALLKQIADQTKGKFYRVTEEAALSSVFHEIDQLEKTQVSSTEKVHYDERFTGPLKLALLLLLLEQLFVRLAVRVVP